MRTCDPNRVDGVCRVDPLETEAGVLRVFEEQTIGFTRLGFGLLRQLAKGVSEPPGRARLHSLSGSSLSVLPAACSLRACSARAASFSGAAPRVRDHFRSDLSSSRIQAANCSCSLAGSFEAWSKAFSRSFVTIAATSNGF